MLVLPLSLFLLAGAKEKDPQKWVYDGVRTCVFEENIGKRKPEAACAQYHMEITHRSGSLRWSEWRYMWKAGARLEVRYTSTDGMLGMSDFTIGRIFVKGRTFQTDRAASYSPSRSELIIGVPNEGYVFMMKGEL